MQLPPNNPAGTQNPMGPPKPDHFWSSGVPSRRCREAMKGPVIVVCSYPVYRRWAAPSKAELVESCKDGGGPMEVRRWAAGTGTSGARLG